jgi:hypothetical protein
MVIKVVRSNFTKNICLILWPHDYIIFTKKLSIITSDNHFDYSIKLKNEYKTKKFP